MTSAESVTSAEPSALTSAESSALTLAEQFLLLDYDGPEDAIVFSAARKMLRPKDEARGYAIDTPWLGAALLFELHALGCIEERDLNVSADHRRTMWEPGSHFVTVAGAAPPEPLLAEALQRLRDAPPAGAEQCMWTLHQDTEEPDHVRDRLLQRLVQRGVLEERTEKPLGLRDKTIYAELRPELKRGLRARVDPVLKGSQPDPRTMALVCLVRFSGTPRYLGILKGKRKFGRVKEVYEDAVERELPGSAVLRAMLDEAPKKPGFSNDNSESIWNPMSTSNRMQDFIDLRSRTVSSAPEVEHVASTSTSCSLPSSGRRG